MAVDERILRSYEDYLSAMDEADKRMDVGKYLLGPSVGPASDPCQGRFVKEIEAAVADIRKADAETIYDSLDYILREPLSQRHRRVAYWMVLAAHRLAIPLVEGISPGQALELYRWFDEAYPWKDRLPAQEKMLKALHKRSKAKK